MGEKRRRVLPIGHVTAISPEAARAACSVHRRVCLYLRVLFDARFSVDELCFKVVQTTCVVVALVDVKVLFKTLRFEDFTNFFLLFLKMRVRKA